MVLNPINQFALLIVEVVVGDDVDVVELLAVSDPGDELQIDVTFAVVVGLVLWGRWELGLSVEEVEVVQTPASLDTFSPPVFTLPKTRIE